MHNIYIGFGIKLERNTPEILLIPAMPLHKKSNFSYLSDIGTEYSNRPKGFNCLILNHSIMNDNLLIITNEIIWYQLVDLKKTTIVSPQIWDIELNQDKCLLSNRDDAQVISKKFDSILLREGHVFPQKSYNELISTIQNSAIPCVNRPNVTELCLNVEEVITKMNSHSILKNYTETAIIHSSQLNEIILPCVVKLPNFHGGYGKWMLKTSEELKKLEDELQTITIGGIDVVKGYVGKEPYLTEKLMVEPVYNGADLRLWVYRDRENDSIKVKGIRRTAKEGEWLANRYTATYELFDFIDPILMEICLASYEILHRPDLVAIDIMMSDKEVKILEINNDVPGMKSLEVENDFSIHKQLLSNLNHLVENPT